MTEYVSESSRKLTRKQQALVDRVVSEPTRSALQTSGLGTGKTVMGVEIAKALGAKTVLVIAPKKTLKQDGWDQTFLEWGWEYPVKFIDSQHPENFAALTAGIPGAYLIGREFYYISANAAVPKKKDDGTLTRGRNARWVWTKTNPDLTIVDECHSLSGRYGLMFGTAKNMPSKFKLGMSATPQGSSFDGIWSVTRWLWPDHVDRSKMRWTAEWCVVEDRFIGLDDEGEPKYKEHVLGEKNPGAFLKSLPCVVQIPAKKLPYKEFNVMVSLTPEQRRVWDEMKEKSIAWLEDHPTVAKLPMEQRIRLRQMALAMPQVDPVTHEVSFDPDAESSKIAAALKIQARHPGEAILYVTDSRKFAEIAAPRLGAKLFVGGMKDSVTDALKADFGVGFKYLVATYGAVAEGTNGLQANCHIEVLFNPADGAVPNEQFSGRLNRIGQPSDHVVRYRLVAKDTLDDEHYLRSVFNVEARRAELAVDNCW